MAGQSRSGSEAKSRAGRAALRAHPSGERDAVATADRAGPRLGNRALYGLNQMAGPLSESRLLSAESGRSALASFAAARALQARATGIAAKRSAGLLSRPVDAAERQAEGFADRHSALPSTAARPQDSETSARGAESRHRAGRPGTPLPGSQRRHFERLLGVELGSVRIHTDSRAEKITGEVDARAATLDQDIHFARGAYSPNTPDGAHLLAHEVVHAAQAISGLIPRHRLMRQPIKDFIDEITPLADDWDIIGSLGEDTPVTPAVIRELLLQYGKVDAAALAACTITAEPGPLGGQIHNFWHPNSDLMARVLVYKPKSRRSTYLFVPKPGAKSGFKGTAPAGKSAPTPAGPPSKPTPPPDKATQGPAEKTPATTIGTVPAPTAGSIDLSELQARIRLVEAAIGRCTDRYRLDASRPQFALVAAARANVATMRKGLTGSSTDLKLIDEAERILERLEKAFALIDERWKEITSQPDLRASHPGYETEIGKVQTLYFQALSKILTAGQTTAFNDAEKAAAALPRALVESDFRIYETRSKYEMMEPSRNEIADWIKTIRTDLDAIEKLAAELGRARENNAPNVPKLEAELALKGEMAQLSIEAVGHWDTVRQVYTYLADERNFIYTAYRSIGRLIQRCRKMRELALAGDLNGLRSALEAYRNDPNIAAFYRGLPVIAAGSRFLVSLGITLIATLVTAGVGGLVAGGAASGTAAATATGITAKTALAFAGTVALEALTFTAVSTILNKVILNQKVSPKSIALDFLWNIGLFGALKGLSLGVTKGVTSLDVPKLASTANVVASMPLLHLYGVLRFRLEEGRWMTKAESETATAQMIIMAAGLSLGTAAVKRWVGAKRASELVKFERDYGFRFREIEAGRQRLIEEAAKLVKENRADDKAAFDNLRERGKKLEEIFDAVVKEIGSKVDLKKLRTELQEVGTEIADESSKHGLSQALGIDISTGLRRGGGSRGFTYAWGKTKQLENRLNALGAVLEKTTDGATGLRRITATFPERDPLVFQERADPVFGETEVSVDPKDPAVGAFMSELGVTDPIAVRTVVRMLTAELARSPKQTLKFAIGQTRTQIKTRAKLSTGKSFQDILLSIHAKGLATSGSRPELAAQAQKLVSEGILGDAAWKEKRTLDGFLGLLGERLGRTVVPQPTAPGGRVLTNVVFTGDQFTDPAGTTLRQMESGRPAKDTTIAELDFMGVSGMGATVVVESVANVKAGSGKGGAAASQNASAISAIQGAVSGKLVPIKDGLTTYYGKVAKVVATDPSGKEINLTGQLAEAKGGPKSETIGPKGAKGYDRPLPYNEKDLKVLVEILREMQFMHSPDY